MLMKKCLLGIMVGLGMSLAYAATSIDVPMYLVSDNGQGESIGTIKLQNSFDGVLITPHLKDLPPGVHGFHVHIKPDCGDKGMAAGGHFDPRHTNKHEGPYDTHGHLGDLPVLIVAQDGTATTPTLAPRLKIKEMEGHTLMIHANGDNYANQPENGGGGARIACGIVKG